MNKVSKSLPSRPNVDYYKKQAKDLVKARKMDDPSAAKRIRENHPRFAKLSEPEFQDAKFSLADAQLVIAREHGFASWPKFSGHVEAAALENSPAGVWQAAQNAVISGDAAKLDRLLRERSEIFKTQVPPSYTHRGPSPDYSGSDPKSIIAREHQFQNWADFAEHLRDLRRPGSPRALFEAAVDAVISGNSRTLKRLLDEHPRLVLARSARTHHATLLHYVGANGVEGFRQKTPKNAARVSEILLSAGADVNSIADMYGGSTTLGLVATSIHPKLAGVQDALIATLLEHGATFDSAVASDYTHGQVVNACLANGRPEAAESLAARGAPLDLEGAAGLGRLEIVKTFFDRDGKLRSGFTDAQMQRGLLWACEYGRNAVVEFLLERGADLHGQAGTQETALHWAVVGGQVETVRLLLHKGARLEELNDYGGTPLSQALWCVVNSDPNIDYVPVIETLLAAGAKIEPESLGWLAKQEGGSPEVKARVRELLLQYGAQS